MMSLHGNVQKMLFRALQCFCLQSVAADFIDLLLHLQVPDQVLIDRVSGRRLDPVTGEIYHLTFKPPPEDIKERLVQRSDDTAEKVCLWSLGSRYCQAQKISNYPMAIGLLPLLLFTHFNTTIYYDPTSLHMNVLFNFWLPIYMYHAIH